MLEAAHNLGVRTAWVAADEVYGGRDLRRRIRTLGYGYAIAVPTSHRVTTPGGGKTQVTALLERVPPRAWMRLKTGHGTKGERLYDWVMIDVNVDDTPPGRLEGHSQVLVRHHRRIGTVSFYRAWHSYRSRYRCWSARYAAGGASMRTSRQPRAWPTSTRAGPGHLLDLLAPPEPDERARLQQPPHDHEPHMSRTTAVVPCPVLFCPPDPAARR
jgi:hypothetical protein